MTHIFHNCEDADAELDRLRTELNAVNSACRLLRGENAELRKALERIAGNPNVPPYGYPCTIAREALAQTAKEEQ